MGEEDIVFVLSPGLGYLADVIGPERVRLVERHPEIAALRDDLDFLVAPSFEKVYEEALDFIDTGKKRLVLLEGVVLEEDRGYYSRVRSAIEAALEKAVEQRLTIEAFGELWERNIRANAESFPRARWISELVGAFRGYAAVLFAAGPGLERQIEDWRGLVGTKRLPKTVLVSVDSAFPFLRTAALPVDYCFTTDPQPVKAEYLSALGETPLVASVLSPPEIVGRATRLFFYGQNHPLEDSLGVPRTARVADPGGSVSTTAAGILLGWGVSEIVLVGQDLAFAEGVTHSRETQAPLRYRFFSREDRAFRIRRTRNLRPVRSVSGKTVWTTPALDSYRRFFSRLARANPEVRFIQTAPFGAEIEGVPSMALSDWLEKRRKNVEK